MKSLRVLNVTQNNLQELPLNITKMHELQIFKVSENPLKDHIKIFLACAEAGANMNWPLSSSTTDITENEKDIRITTDLKMFLQLQPYFKNKEPLPQVPSDHCHDIFLEKGKERHLPDSESDGEMKRFKDHCRFAPITTIQNEDDHGRDMKLEDAHENHPALILPNFQNEDNRGRNMKETRAQENRSAFILPVFQHEYEHREEEMEEQEEEDQFCKNEYDQTTKKQEESHDQNRHLPTNSPIFKQDNHDHDHKQETQLQKENQSTSKNKKDFYLDPLPPFIPLTDNESTNLHDFPEPITPTFSPIPIPIPIPYARPTQLQEREQSNTSNSNKKDLYHPTAAHQSIPPTNNKSETESERESINTRDWAHEPRHGHGYEPIPIPNPTRTNPTHIQNQMRNFTLCGNMRPRGRFPVVPCRRPMDRVHVPSRTIEGFGLPSRDDLERNQMQMVDQLKIEREERIQALRDQWRRHLDLDYFSLDRSYFTIKG